MEQNTIQNVSIDSDLSNKHLMCPPQTALHAHNTQLACPNEKYNRAGSQRSRVNTEGGASEANALPIAPFCLTDEFKQDMVIACLQHSPNHKSRAEKKKWESNQLGRRRRRRKWFGRVCESGRARKTKWNWTIKGRHRRCIKKKKRSTVRGFTGCNQSEGTKMWLQEDGG